MAKKAAVVMDTGFEELEAMGPIALLRRAGMEVDLVSAHNGDEVTGRFGVTYKPATPFKDYDFSNVDVLIVPGGGHWPKIEANEEVKQVIRQFYDDPNKWLAAICAAPTILGRMGLLKGKNYTCFTSMDEDFGGTYIDQRAVVDGHLITGRSADASIDFAYAIMESVLGKEKTEEVKASIFAH
ncbi:DJ-1/PfpI family protein [Allobaculum stercoricanis]|uniref:DJ-1/PfpI family protein n=1 Tax=Allobaculum stercoricanis TaxID=174709 RepID=UPI0003675680|nr:DJ-1/PfpI family protein [Allobaculum stercoricanis]